MLIKVVSSSLYLPGLDCFIFMYLLFCVFFLHYPIFRTQNSEIFRSRRKDKMFALRVFLAETLKAQRAKSWGQTTKAALAPQ